MQPCRLHLDWEHNLKRRNGRITSIAYKSVCVARITSCCCFLLLLLRRLCPPVSVNWCIVNPVFVESKGDPAPNVLRLCTLTGALLRLCGNAMQSLQLLFSQTASYLVSSGLILSGKVILQVLGLVDGRRRIFDHLSVQLDVWLVYWWVHISVRHALEVSKACPLILALVPMMEHFISNSLHTVHEQWQKEMNGWNSCEMRIVCRE